MKEFDIVLKNGNIFPINRKMDMGIKDGKIVAVEKDLGEYKAKEIIDADNLVVSPGFVDANIHMDCAMTVDEGEDTDLLSAYIEHKMQVDKPFEEWTNEDIKKEMIERYIPVVEMAIANGTTAIKANISITSAVKSAALDAALYLKQKYKDYISIFTVVNYSKDIDDLWMSACKDKKIDFIGCKPDITYDKNEERYVYNNEYQDIIDAMLSKAMEYKMPIDFHCCQFDTPDVEAFEYIIDKTYQNHLQGQVTCGNVNALDSRDIKETDAARIIAKCAKAEVNITTMPSNDLFLMDYSRRGGTRVEQLQQAGVKISVASGNVRDSFNPFGRLDLLEEALTAAQMYKFGTDKKLMNLFRMITYYPADSLLLNDYGVLPGCNADLVVLEADSVKEAILSQVNKKYVIKNGKITVKDSKLV